jgi:shikimate kinase
VEGDLMIEFNNRKNIVFIGMAACGKSTIGVLIAKALDMTFIDTDLIIQQKYGKLLGQLLEDIGSKEFIIKESNVICSLDCTNSCISTGGSVVYSDKAMNYLKQIADIVYINLSYPIIKKRLADIDIKGRGIVIDKGKTLFDVYSERKVLYSKYADYTIDADDKSIEELVTQIISLLIR